MLTYVLLCQGLIVVIELVPDKGLFQRGCVSEQIAAVRGHTVSHLSMNVGNSQLTDLL